MPATTCPLAGSMMSPTAFTTASADTMRPFGNAMDAVPTPPFIGWYAEPVAPNNAPSFPTVAPAPAPTLPSATRPFDAAAAAL